LGGSQRLYPRSIDGRAYLSFWGGHGARGGCCHNDYNSGAAWRQSFDLYYPYSAPFSRGRRGVDACRRGYVPIKDGPTCAAGANALGLVYSGSANDGHPAALCNWCGGCTPRTVRVSNSHGGFADYICILEALAHPDERLYKSVGGHETPSYSDCATIPNSAPYIKLVMGSVVDYFRPIEGKTYCDMLNSYSNHQWSKDGKNFVTPTYHTGRLGGSQRMYPRAIDGRVYLSFWGGHGARGGCCHNAYNSGAAWHQSFYLYYPYPETINGAKMKTILIANDLLVSHHNHWGGADDLQHLTFVDSLIEGMLAGHEYVDLSPLFKGPFNHEGRNAFFELKAFFFDCLESGDKCLEGNHASDWFEQRQWPCWFREMLINQASLLQGMNAQTGRRFLRQTFGWSVAVDEGALFQTYVRDELNLFRDMSSGICRRHLLPTSSRTALQAATNFGFGGCKNGQICVSPFFAEQPSGRCTDAN